MKGPDSPGGSEHKLFVLALYGCIDGVIRRIFAHAMIKGIAIDQAGLACIAPLVVLVRQGAEKIGRRFIFQDQDWALRVGLDADTRAGRIVKAKVWV